MRKGNEMKKYYLNTYDAAARFNLSDEMAKDLFDRIEIEMSGLGYDVVRECALNDSNDLDDFELELDEMSVFKKLDLA